MACFCIKKEKILMKTNVLFGITTGRQFQILHIVSLTCVLNEIFRLTLLTCYSKMFTDVIKMHA